jgi:hypothetical protein
MLLRRRSGGTAATSGAGIVDYDEFPPDEFLGASLSAWWYASGAGLTQSGGLVTAWTDEIAGITTTITGSPTYTTINSVPAVGFNGTDQYFSNTAAKPGTWPTGTTEGWVWVVVSQDDTPSGVSNSTRSAVAYGNSGANQARGVELVCIGGTANRARACKSTASAGATYTSALFDGVHVVGGQFIEGAAASVSVTGRFDGTVFNNLNGSFNTSGTRFRIGADIANVIASFWKGKIASVMITTTLTTPQIEYIEGWAAWKYGF